MRDDKDLQQARVSAAADEERRGLVTSGGRGSETAGASPPDPLSLGGPAGEGGHDDVRTEVSLAGRTRELLRRFELRPRKSLGQNFLINPLKVAEIATAALEAVDRTGAGAIVEVGPGLGALTVALAEGRGATAPHPPAPLPGGEGSTAGDGAADGGPAEARPLRGGALPIVAFEVDRWLEAPLAELLGGYPDVSVRYEDFLAAEVGEAVGGAEYVLAGNLPYNITAPLLEKLLVDPLCQAMVITVQREVADRLRAGPGSKAYGPLTLFCAYYVRMVEVVTQLHPGDFLPPPQIDSTALRLVKRAEPPFAKPSAEAFERAVRGAFNHRRKSLRAGLALTTRLGMSRGQVEDALEAAEISGDRRAETLNMGEFARLAQALDEVRSGA